LIKDFIGGVVLRYGFNDGSSAPFAEKKGSLGQKPGGYSTKTHASGDGWRNPLELRITGG
jgi:hypothetical protein